MAKKCEIKKNNMPFETWRHKVSMVKATLYEIYDVLIYVSCFIKIFRSLIVFTENKNAYCLSTQSVLLFNIITHSMSNQLFITVKYGG